MDSITLRLQPSTKESLEGEAEERGVSRSEYIRNILRSRHELERLREQVADLERENDRLRQQLAATNRRVDQHQELVRYVQEERSLAQEQSRRRKAPVWRRAKWWILGEPNEEK